MNLYRLISGIGRTILHSILCVRFVDKKNLIVLYIA